MFYFNFITDKINIFIDAFYSLIEIIFSNIRNLSQTMSAD